MTRTIPGLPGYFATSAGHIVNAAGHQLREHTHPRGYKLIYLPVGSRQLRVHRLVASAYHGPCPAGQECCHNDGDPANNQPNNLRWDTHRNNTLDTVRHGTCPGFQKAKLSPDQVREIRHLHRQGVSVRATAARFNINRGAIEGIIYNRTYRYVQAA